ncbi:agmatinase [Maribacter sp. HTCC2170]|uniref:agmatinase n=1 Tax=Maribacter sp. (strain HTCC2170 / KCCM 42371) TaxID=313603 RepID=UPI00006AFC69|nr:agmatinase [Maribacter sp. HTCC2170]EAR01193.1 arginase [Maribacter sp. HTCC2170]
MKSDKIGLQGILFDAKSSFMQGPALAPPLIRKAYNSDSANYFTESGLELRPESFNDKGDFAIEKYFEIERITQKNLITDQPLITLGGDHSITYPIIKAMTNTYGPVSILHIDAHSDLYHEFEGDKYSHACPFARIMEDKLVNRLVQVGIRTLSKHQKEQADKYGVEIIQMKDFNIGALPKFDAPIYISLDIDALDPAFAPGVSHHEPGGLSTRDVLHIIQNINSPVIGADIVEYNPSRDINGMTAMVCAKFLKEIAAKIVQNKI